MEPARHEMLFNNPLFQDGLNLTARKGDKWMKLKIGDKLDIKRTAKDTVLCTATVVGREEFRFDAIPRDLLDYEHDPGCRTYAGLFCGMKNAYRAFTANSNVTLVFFVVDKKKAANSAPGAR